MMTENEQRTAILYGGIKALETVQHVIHEDIRSREVDLKARHNLGEIFDGVPKEFQRAHIAAMKHCLELVQAITLEK